MLEVAGLGVAMDNAVDSLKLVADYVGGKDGVINAIFGDAHITSPDPTIVNVGTDGIMHIHFPEPRDNRQQPAQPEAMVVAV